MAEPQLLTLNISLKEFKEAGIEVDENKKKVIVTNVIKSVLLQYISSAILTIYMEKEGNVPTEELVNRLAMIVNSLSNVDETINVEDEGDEIVIQFKLPIKIPYEQIFQLMYIAPKIELLADILNDRLMGSKKLSKWLVGV